MQASATWPARDKRARPSKMDQNHRNSSQVERDLRKAANESGVFTSLRGDCLAETSTQRDDSQEALKLTKGSRYPGVACVTRPNERAYSSCEANGWLQQTHHDLLPSHLALLGGRPLWRPD